MKEKEITRAGFVRGLPLEIPVEEVIRLGKKAGLEIKKGDVYAARHYMKKMDEDALRENSSTSEERPRPAMETAFGRASLARVANGESASEQRQRAFRHLTIDQQFKLFVKRLGTVRARALIDEVEHEFLD